MPSNDRPPQAGERQQVDVVDHPEHGRCFAVWGNGPSFIQPVVEGGEPRSARIGVGGSSRDEGSWRLIDGRKCSLVEIGEAHQRAWHPRMGLGWLVYLPDARTVRFEPDDGATRWGRAGLPLVFEWTALSVGRPEYARRLERARTRIPKHGPDEMNWMTFTTADGELLTFRKDGPPPDREKGAESTQARKGPS